MRRRGRTAPRVQTLHRALRSTNPTPVVPLTVGFETPQPCLEYIFSYLCCWLRTIQQQAALHPLVRPLRCTQVSTNAGMSSGMLRAYRSQGTGLATQKQLLGSISI